ncbi:MAG TPA: thioredoxin family protein [Candidatus Poseidoniaceae archaeon]|nr:MAG: thioredoxin family protein [Euryarchaeota archaeon TMED141]DAC10047.1 MAG TPA: thioredoxin family protein [Candidatus Poseidoniales archaeon]DAC18055.1 MAG TPA: thioredoxin family protein [Candidatus Poseidoniales archaeon]HII18608.1 thioredoxin family protein [Candidatus Poseidoniaceae archaeon]HII96577.1 thioredoxin family protein [Candidatus Poseidoniaceae archaeon]
MSLEPGMKAPDFHLPNANANQGPDSMDLASARGQHGTIVVFECNHCPYVVASVGRLNAMAEHAASVGVGFVGINSNDPVVYENDSWENMVKRANDGMPYPYLHDAEQTAATAWGAERTPEVYLLNAEDEVVYRGRMDDSPKDPGQVTVEDLRLALDAMLSGTAPDVARTQSIGCSVKWKA